MDPCKHKPAGKLWVVQYKKESTTEHKKQDAGDEHEQFLGMTFVE